MKDKTFHKLLLAVVGTGLVCTIAHLIYAIDAYQSCSIIHFIATELW